MPSIEGTPLESQDFSPPADYSLIARQQGPKLATLLTTMRMERVLILLCAGLG